MIDRMEHVTDEDLVRVARIDRQRRGETTRVLHRGNDGISRLRDPHTGKILASFVSAPDPEPEPPITLGWIFVVAAFFAAAAVTTAVLWVAWHLYLAANHSAA